MVVSVVPMDGIKFTGNFFHRVRVTFEYNELQGRWLQCG